MSPIMIGAIGIGLMLILMFMGTRVGIAMAVVGFVGIALILGTQAGLATVGIQAISTLEDYGIAQLPIFLLMGEFADLSGMMRDSYRTANTWLGNLPGGLAMASIVGAGAFSAVSGSSMACAAIMTRVALPNLLEHKYDPRLAVGSLAAGGTLGNLVPPGVLFIFYAIMSQTSVGQLFIASTIPGVLLCVMYLIQIYIQCRINPKLGPRAGSNSLNTKIKDLKYAIPLIAVFGLVMGGIMFGLFTTFEAAAFGTIFVFVFALIRRKLNKQNFIQSLKNTLATTGMACAIIIGARIFTSFVAVSGLSQNLADWVITLHVAPIVVVIMIMLVYFVLGTAMDTMSMLLLTLPIFIGVVRALNIDLIWFGVLVIVQMELSNISPPVGMNLFIVSSMAKDKGITMGMVFKGVLPFCLTMLIFNVMLLIWPQIAMWLPGLMTPK